MVNRCMQILVIALSLSLFLAVAISFAFIPRSDNKDIYQQPSRLTGYPTWHEKVKGFDPNRDDAMGLLSVTLMILGGIIGLKAIRNPPTNPKLTTHFFTISDDSDSVPTGVPTIGFNSMLVLYNWFTLFTVFASLTFDLGKIWVVIGTLHNTAEIITLVLLGNGGKIRNSNFLGVILFYILFVVSTCIFLDFPGDAGFFKFQGLCMDFALVIEFIRILITTKNHVHDAGRDILPLNVDDEENNDDNHDARTQPCAIYPSTINHPNQLWLLIVASGFHLTGNVVITFFNDLGKALLLFRLTYPITFSVYMFYVYLDTYAASVLPQKRIYLPNTPRWKIIVIAIFSITLSALTLRTSLAIVSAK